MGKDTKTAKAPKPTKKDAPPTPAKSLKRKTVDDDAPSKDSIQPPAKTLKSTASEKLKPASSKEAATKAATKVTKPTPTQKPTASASTAKTKKAKKATSPTPEPASEEEEIVPLAEDSSDEENDYLAGFSTDEDSSDEEDAMDAEPAPIEISKLPTVAKDDAAVKRKLEKAKKQPTEDRGVLYVGRIPHGFYEEQMKAYFTQFGNVTRLRLSRNKKTGKPKHYGFVEFDSSSVAQIVAETMDNYLLMGHLLQCKVIPKDKVHPDLWVGANRKWRVVPADRLQRVKHNKDRTEDDRKRVNQRLLKRQTKKQQKLKELGINYELDSVGYKKPAIAED